MDEDLLHQQSTTHQCLITMEDNVLAGGFGSAILESLEGKKVDMHVKRIGWPDQFIDHGDSTHSLRKKYSLDENSIFQIVDSILKDLKIRKRRIAV